MTDGDTGTPTSTALTPEQATERFAALRAETESLPAETEDVTPTETTPESEAEPVVEEPPVVEKVRFKIGDAEYDEDTLLEWQKSGLRQADYTKKTQEVSAKAQKLEQERATEREETLKKWQALEDAVAFATPKEPDWVALQAQVRAGTLSESDYHHFAAQWLADSQQRQAIVEERQKAEQAVQADRAKKAEATAKQNYETVLTLIPEWKDVETRQKDWGEMSGYIKEIAPDLDESALLGAHPALFKAVRDALQYHKLQQNTSKPKVVKVDASTLKPGSAVSAQPKTSELDTAARRLAQTHSEADGVAAFRALRKAGGY